MTIEAVRARVPEGEPVQFRFTRTGDTTGTLGVRFNVVPAHPVLPTGTRTLRTEVSFARGSRTVIRTFPTDDDDLDERDGEVWAAITTNDNYRIGDPGSVTVTVIDNDLPLVSVAAADTVPEGEPAVFTLTRVGDTRDPLTVNLLVAKARQGGPTLESSPETVSFQAGSAETVWRVETEDDEVDQPSLLVTVSVSPPSGGGDNYRWSPPTGTATTTVTDDDLPTVTIASRTTAVTEGENVVFTLTRVGDTTIELAVPVNMSREGDFWSDAGPTVATFTGGNTETTLTVLTDDDDRDEENGSVTATIAAGDSWKIGSPGSALVTVADNDALQVVRFVSDVVEVEEGKDIVFTLIRKQVIAGILVEPDGRGPLTVNVEVTQVGDFIRGPRPSTAVFGAGASSVTLTVATEDDGRIPLTGPSGGYRVEFESHGSVTMTIIAGDDYATGAPDSATVQVRDNDGHDIILRPVTRTVNEGSEIAFELERRHGDERRQVTVDPFDLLAVECVGGALLPDSDPSNPLARDRSGGALAVFPAGERTTTYSLPTADDEIYECDIRVRQSLFGGDRSPEGVWYAPSQGVVHEFVVVRDDDPPPTLRIDNVGADEDVGEMVFTGTLGQGSSRWPTRVALKIVPGTAEAGEDYQAVTGAWEFAPLENGSREFRVPITNDMLDEDDETFELVLGGGITTPHPRGRWVLLPNEKPTGAITDNDPLPSLSIASAEAPEDGGEMTFEVVLEPVSGRTVEVSFHTVDGTAEAPSDYTEARGTLTFDKGETKRRFAVEMVNDDVDEWVETFSANLSNPVNAELSASVATGTIWDDDLSTVTIRANSASVVEGQPALFTLTRTRSSAELSVRVELERLGAFTFGFEGITHGRLKFPADETEYVLDIETLADEVSEPDGTIAVRILPLAPPTYVVGDPSKAVVAVTDDDRGLRIRDATHSEESRTPDGREDLEMQFRVTLDHPEEQTVTVNWATQDGTAKAGEDYIAASGSLTFEPDVTEQTFSVTVVNDWIEEHAESFTVVLTGAVNARLAEDTATGTITDADRNPEIYIESNPEAVVEGQNVVFTLARDSTCGECPNDQRPATVTVNIAMTQKGEFVSEPLPTEVYFGPQPRTVALEIPTVDDAVDEPDGWLELEIVEGAGYFTRTTGNTSALVAIRDNDTASTSIVLSVVPERLSEAGPTEAEVAVALADGSRFAEEKTVVVAVDPASAATRDVDYTLSDTRIRIPAGAGAGEAAVTLTVLDDPIDEEEETLTLTATLDGHPVGEPRTVSISDDDTRGVTLSRTELIVPEGGSGSYTVVLDSQPTAAEVTVLVRAPPDTDVSVSQDQASLTFTPSNWSQPQTVTVEAAHDPDAEADPAVVLTHTVSGGDYRSVTASDVIVTISDDDTASTGIALTLDPERVTEQGGQQTVTVTAMLNAVFRTEDTVVNVMVAGDTATVVDDFAAVPSFSITIPANRTSGEADFTLTPVDDAVAEGNEAIEVSGTAAGLTVAPALLTLADNDEPSTEVSLVMRPESLGEEAGGTVVEVRGMLNAGSRTVDTVVTLMVAGDTAEAEDFQVVGDLKLTIPANQQSGMLPFLLVLTDDSIAEGDETLTVSGAATGLTVNPATLTISDNDTASTGIKLTLDPERVSEDGGQQTVTVTAMLDAGARTADTVVQVSVAGDTATVVEDFAVVHGFEITIPATEARATGAFTVTPVDDTIAEGDETLQVSGTSPLTVTAAELTISDNDTASTGIVLTLDPTLLTEQGGQQTVTVTAMLNAGARTADTVVQVSVAGDTATVVEDFAVVHGFEITIPATEARATGAFTVTPVDDTIAEGDETLQVSGTATGLTVNPATLAIGDDDTASTGIVLTLDPTLLTEQGGQQTVTVTAMLNAGARTGDTVVNVSVAEASATEGTDFTAVGNFQITIPATQPSGQNTFSLTPVDDTIAEGDETLQVSGTATGLTVDGATLTLADDDTASTGIALTLDLERVTEQGGQQTVTVMATLNAGARTADTVVQVSVAGDTATVVEDFAVVHGFEITIPATEARATGAFTVTPADDAIAEGEETLTVSGTATGLTVDPATLTLADDDTASTGIALTLDPERVTEDGGQQTVMVTAMLDAGVRTADTVVNVTLAGLTATAVDDFQVVQGFPITIPATEISATGAFTVTPVDDTIAEGEETLTVSGTSPLPVTPATLTLRDDDTASTGIALTLDLERVTEQGGQQTVTVMATLDAGARTADTVVQVSVAGDTATVVEDFGAVGNFTITIPATQPSGQNTFTLTPVDDAIAEGEETLTVSGTATGLTVDPATLTLADDDTASTGIALTLNPQRVTEQGGQQTVTVTAMLNAGARTGDTVVNVSVAEASATEGTDFAAVRNFQITLPANQASGQNTFSLTPVNDTIAEGDETLQVSGTSPLTVTAAELTLADDDTASTGIALTLDPERVTEDGGRQTVTVTAMLNAGARTGDTVVNVLVAEASATEGTDFTAVGNFQITIPAGAGSGEADFTLTPVNDTIAEGDETLQVSGTATGLTVDGATLTLADDDTASTGIALTLDPQRVTEQGGQQTVMVMATLNAGARTADTVVQVSVAGDTATVVEDFGAVGNFTITIPATQPSGQNTFSLTPVDDTIAEGDETLQVSGTATGLTVDPATLTLADDDTASTGIALTLDPERVTEDGGQQTVMVTAMLDAGVRTADTVVNVTLAGLTATAVDDFQVVQGFPITIPATEISATGAFTLTPVNDTIAEGEETLQVSGTATGLTVDRATLTLRDDDTASTGIALTLDPERVTEQGGQQTVTVMATLNAGARTADTVVQVSVAGDTATVVEDFAVVHGFEITIPATEARATGAFTVTPVDDTIAEGDETLQVSGTATGLTVNPATLAIGDDDTASTGIVLTLDPTLLTEQGGQQTVTVTAMLNAGARTGDTVVNVSVAEASATEGTDFTAVGNFQITIPATQPSGQNTFSLTPVDDTIAEGDETLQVSGTATGLTVDPATLTLADDDTASTGIALTLDPERVTEDGGQQTVMVTAMLDAGVRTADTVVNVTLAGLTATAVDDFQVVQGFPITIPATEISATGAFTVTPVDDTIAEGEETLTVSGASPLPVTPATLTLRDDDTASTGIALTLDLERVTEQGGQQTVTVMATLNAGARTADTVVQVSVAGDTATVVEDFAVVHGFEITIPATEARATGAFTVTPVDDTIAEGDETLQVSGTATGLTVNPATLAIGDDDTASTGIVLTLDPTLLTEQGGQQTVTVTAMLNAGARTGDTVVNVLVAGDTATAGDDFAPVPSFTITIPAIQPSGQNTFTLTPVNDTIAEGEETLQVSGTATGLTVDRATLTLRDDDTASTGIALTLNPQRVTEQGGQQTVTVTAMLDAGARTGDTVVNVSVAEASATEGTDFTAVGNFQITIPATQPSGQNTFSLTPVNDTIAEGDETLQVSGTATGLTVDGATLTLADDDTASTGIALTLDPQRVTEDGGQQTVMVMATLNAGARTADTVVQVSVAGDTATVVEDFGAVGNFTITIPATQPSGQNTFSLTPVDDTIAEGDETLQVSGTSPLTVTAAELTLADDDTASTGIALTLDPERVTEDGGQQTVTVTATLDAGTRTADTVVQVSVAGDTATVVEDFGAVGNFTITIPATQPSGQNTFSLTPVDDAIAEGEETLTVSGTATGLTVDPATLTLADDDTASTGIALTLNPQRVTEQGGQQTVTVTAMLNAGARTGDTVVNVSVAEASATEGTDFAAVRNFQITLPANQASGQNTFSLTPVNDTIAEGDETLQVSGTSPLTVTAAELTLADDDTASTGIALTLDPERVTEDGGRQTVTVTAMLNAGARTGDTVVNVLVAEASATEGTDFTAVGNFQITIPAGAGSGEADFTLTPVNDTIAEGDETLQVSGTATGLTVDGATLTLADDDTASTGIALTLDPQRVTEQGGQQTVMVMATLNAGARTADTVVQVSVAGDTATVVEDFGAVGNFTITIPATQPSGQNTFSLTPVDDTIAEGDETLQVSGTATGLTVDPATLTLADDDTASTGIALTLDPERVTEDGGQQTVMVTAMLDAGVRTADTVVNVTLAGLTATAVDDFQVVQGFPITIPATEISATGAFTLTPVNDTIAEGEETLQVSGTATGLTVDRATLTLRDDDTASTGIALTLDPERVTEQGGQQTVTVMATLNAGARTADTVVQVSVAGDTATVVEDFAVVHGFEITIPATEARATGAFTVTPVDDTIAEGDETLQVSGTATGLTVNPATLAIGDDDTASTGIVLTLDPTLLTEQGGQQTVTVTAMLNAGARTGDTVVNVSVGSQRHRGNGLHGGRELPDHHPRDPTQRAEHLLADAGRRHHRRRRRDPSGERHRHRPDGGWSHADPGR